MDLLRPYGLRLRVCRCHYYCLVRVLLRPVVVSRYQLLRLLLLGLPVVAM